MVMTVNEKMTQLADAVRDEAKYHDKLSIDGMIREIHNIPTVVFNHLLAPQSPITSITYTNMGLRINNAFSYMPELLTAYLPNIQVLAQGTFNYCKKLKLVDIGEYCYRVENMTFFNCSALDTLILRRTASVCNVPQGALVGTPIEAGTGYIYVPKALLSAYEADSNYIEEGYKFRAIEDYPDISNSVVAADIEITEE
jgi:hypothetical protein